MDKVWWFGVAVLTLSGLALGVMVLIYIQEGKRLNISVEDRSYNFDKEDWPISVEDQVYACCDHCFNEHGEYPNGRNAHPVNNHSLPCEICQEYI